MIQRSTGVCEDQGKDRTEEDLVGLNWQILVQILLYNTWEKKQSIGEKDDYFKQINQFFLIISIIQSQMN